MLSYDDEHLVKVDNGKLLKKSNVLHYKLYQIESGNVRF